MTKKYSLIAAAALLSSTFFLSSCQSVSPIPTTTTSSIVQPSAAPKTTTLSCPTGTLFGEGSSAQKIGLDSLITSYAVRCNHRAEITYASYSSGSGIKSFSTSLVHFAGVDSLPANKTNTDGLIEAEAARQRCSQNPAWTIPIFISPLAFVYHLDGVPELVLNPTVISKIFSGQIVTWDDPELKALNPSASLPTQQIVPFYRSDESGTSESISAFLNATSPQTWPHSPTRQWAGTAGSGKHQSTGVIDAVLATPASIGYVEWPYAKKNSVSVAALDVGKGAVRLTATSASLAAKNVTLTDETPKMSLHFPYGNAEAESYPALMGSYLLVCSKGGITADETQLLKDFLSHATASESQHNLADLGYLSLPELWRNKIEIAISEIR